MRIEITPRSATYGGGATLWLVGDFLLDGLPDVSGPSVRIDVEFLVRSEPRAPYIRAVDEPDESVPHEPDPADPESIHEDIGIGPSHPEWGREHEKQRERGPSLTYRRTANKVALRVISELSEYDVFATHHPTPETFATAAREVVSALAKLPLRIKSGDDLDAVALLEHLHSQLGVLPENQDELDKVLAPLAEADARRWQTMDGWDLVDVDWSEFAPGTQERLNDPFFFDPSDDESPHGNDTGADLLAEYLAERPDDALAFVNRHADEMGHASLAALKNDDPWEHDELVIAAAFAELKVRGYSSPDLTQLALQALDRKSAEANSPRTAQLRAALQVAFT